MVSALFASTTVAVVTLVVATVIYRWQKLIDRETAIQIEMRELCGEYLTFVKAAYFDQPMIGDEDADKKAKEFYSIGKNEREAYAARDRLSLIAPDNLCDALSRCDEAFRTWKIEFTSHQNYDIADDHKATVKELGRNFLKSFEELRQEMKLEIKVRSRIGLSDVAKALFGKEK